jgi:hypothetical protein
MIITIDISKMSTMQQHLLRRAIVDTLDRSARDLRSDIKAWYADTDSPVYRELQAWERVASETARDVERQFATKRTNDVPTTPAPELQSS